MSWELRGLREARDLISKIRSCTVRSDHKNKAFSAVFCLFLRSDLTVQDRILEIRSLASLGVLRKFGELEGVLARVLRGGFSLERNEEQHPRQHSLQHPEFSQHSSQHPPQLFSEFPVSLFCSRPRSSQVVSVLQTPWPGAQHSLEICFRDGSIADNSQSKTKRPCSESLLGLFKFKKSCLSCCRRHVRVQGQCFTNVYYRAQNDYAHTFVLFGN